MTKLYALLMVIFCSISCSLCEPNFDENSSSNHPNTILAEAEAGEQQPHSRLGSDAPDLNYDKRMERYAFGLGRRAYTYTNGNGMKRLPVYNFGLGKRGRPYSFGLGKRADYDDEQQYDLNDIERSLYEKALLYGDEKRSRPYSFGLGKRSDYLEEVDRRGYPNRYGFGLGRR